MAIFGSLHPESVWRACRDLGDLLIQASVKEGIDHIKQKPLTGQQDFRTASFLLHSTERGCSESQFGEFKRSWSLYKENVQIFLYLNLLLDIIIMTILKVISLPGNVQNVVKKRSLSFYTGFALSIGFLSLSRCHFSD